HAGVPDGGLGGHEHRAVGGDPGGEHREAVGRVVEAATVGQRIGLLPDRRAPRGFAGAVAHQAAAHHGRPGYGVDVAEGADLVVVDLVHRHLAAIGKQGGDPAPRDEAADRADGDLGGAGGGEQLGGGHDGSPPGGRDWWAEVVDGAGE